jgi:hypothetical protein
MNKIFVICARIRSDAYHGKRSERTHGDKPYERISPERDGAERYRRHYERIAI